MVKTEEYFVSPSSSRGIEPENIKENHNEPQPHEEIDTTPVIATTTLTPIILPELTPLVPSTILHSTTTPSPIAVTTTTTTTNKPLLFPETKTKLENLPLEQLEKLFKELLRRSGMTSTWKWEDCQRNLNKEPLWKAIKTYSEKKRIFNDYIQECRTKEREEQRLKKDRLKAKFRELLDEDHSLTSDTRFGEIAMRYLGDDRWRGLEDREREDIFQDYVEELEEREEEEKKIQRETKIKNLRRMFEEKKLPVTTKWKEVQMNLQNDFLFGSMEKIDRLTAFKNYIIELENKDKEINEEAKNFIEYKNRENFREFLQENVDNGNITAKTKWRKFINQNKNNVQYLNLIGQEGSTPKELFDDVVSILISDYKRNKETLKKILKTNGIRFSSDTTFEQFEERLKSFYDFNKMRNDQKKTLYAHLIKKLKSKDKEKDKILNKTLRKLRSFLVKKLKISENTKFESVVNIIKSHHRYTNLDEKIIKRTFEEVIAHIRSGNVEELIRKKEKKSKKKKKERKGSEYYLSGSGKKSGGLGSSSALEVFQYDKEEGETSS